MRHVDFHDGRHVVMVVTWGEPVVNTGPSHFVMRRIQLGMRRQRPKYRGTFSKTWRFTDWGPLCPKCQKRVICQNMKYKLVPFMGPSEARFSIYFSSANIQLRKLRQKPIEKRTKTWTGVRSEIQNQWSVKPWHPEKNAICYGTNVIVGKQTSDKTVKSGIFFRKISTDVPNRSSLAVAGSITGRQHDPRPLDCSDLRSDVGDRALPYINPKAFRS